MTGAATLPYHLRRRRRATSRAARRGRRGSPVIDLTSARDARRLADFRRRLSSVQDANRRTLSRLFQSGLIFSRAGSRLGRDLLLSHQHLLKVGDLLARLEDATGGRRRSGETEALYAQVQVLLVRTSELSARSDGLLARRR